MFVDDVVLHLKAGDGGNGSCSFRREKFIPRGGPDGGNGGSGGSVIIVGSSSYSNLSKFKHQKHFIAASGRSGHGRLQTGESGEDIEILVPLGTQVIDYDSNVVLCDICKHDQKFLLLEGGRGGRGNATFKTSINKAPRQTTEGVKGKGGKFILRLKLMCDVGIIGFPNSGKSTLINAITNTKSIVGDYPFTTLKPVLGVLEVDYQQYVLADIPGLIENAHNNIGLGHKFLRHIERCKAIIHLIDVNSEDLRKDYDIIRNELKMYSNLLLKKREIIVFSKIDMCEDLDQKMLDIKSHFNRKKYLFISSFTGENLEKLGNEIAKLVDKLTIS